jgi:hypothetical protein
VSADDQAVRQRSIYGDSNYAVARSGLFGISLIVVVLIGVTGAGTEGQPALLASLCLVVGCFVLIGFLVAYAGWRLRVHLGGIRLTVRRLRTRTVDLSQVETVTRHGWIDQSVVLTERSDGTRRRRRATIPLSTRVIYGVVEIPAWANDDAQLLVRAVFEELPPDVTFDTRAGAWFRDAGCSVDRVS